MAILAASNSGNRPRPVPVELTAERACSGPPEFVILNTWPVDGFTDLMLALADAHERMVEDADDFAYEQRITSSTAGPITQVTLAKADRPKGGALYALELS